MATDYSKVGKLYNLTSTATIPITGASVIHGIYNGANANIVVTIDNVYSMHVASDSSIVFPNPISFSGVKTSASNATGVILYS
jgi:hypothetical protein